MREPRPTIASAIDRLATEEDGENVGEELANRAIEFQATTLAAALELALKQRGSKLFEVRAPGFRQQKILAEPSHKT